MNPLVSESRGPRSTGIVLAVVLLLLAFVAAVVHWRLGIPGVAQLRGYLYVPRHRVLHPTSWAPLALFVVIAAHATARRVATRRFELALALATVSALAAQLYTAGLDGPGFHSLLTRFENGHRDFLTAARVHRDRVDFTLRHYENLATNRALGLYAPSKPPGVHLVYAGIDALGQESWFQESTPELRAQADRHPGIGPERDAAVAAAVLFPLGTALAVIPFGLLAALLLGDRKRAIDVCTVFATAPNYLILSGHLDGALLPLLAGTFALALALGMRRNSAAWLGLAGMLAVFGIWTSFSLLPAVGYAGLCALAVLARRRRVDRELVSVTVRSVALVAIGVAAAVVLLDELGWLGVPAQRLRDALVYHGRWKYGVVGGGEGALVGLAEFGCYFGLPLMFAVVFGAIAAIRHRSRESILGFGIPALLGVQALNAGCSEAARLWMFVVPFLAIGMAPWLRRIEGRRRHGIIAGVLIVLNLALVPIIRASQGW